MAKPEVVSELKAAISEAGATIAELFGAEDITNTEIFKKEKQNAHEHARRVEKVLGEE